MKSILLVEDEGIIRSALKRLLERNGYQVYEAGSVPEAKQVLAKNSVNLIISDLRLPGEVGTELINSNIPVLIMTSYASVKSAVDALKLGAVEYLAKPFNHDEMLATVASIFAQLPAKPAAIEKVEDLTTTSFGGMLGEGPAMQEVFNQIKKVAPFNTRVLILGESGTGKELVARALHNHSPRHSQPFIAVNCAAIPETLIEAELFGYEKGAFTGANTSRNGLVEAADGGTLFLDEIGELPLEAQARLLRVLQEGEIRRLGSVEAIKVDVRLVAATHRNLAKMIDQGRFRLDLYYRLNVIELELPNLAARGEDVLLLAKSLLETSCQNFERSNMKFSKAAEKALLSYSWPGNIRELENKIERAVILANSNLLQPQDLQLASLDKAQVETSVKTAAPVTKKQLIEQPIEQEEPPVLSEDLSLEDYFVHYVLENEDKMSETQLAKKLGVSRKCLWERRQKFGIPRRR